MLAKITNISTREKVRRGCAVNTGTGGDITCVTGQQMCDRSTNV